MPTIPALYLGWTVKPTPGTPAAQSLETSRTDIVGITVSPFTGQQQTQDWGAFWYEAAVTMATLTPADGAIWRDWIISMKGQKNVTAFTNSAMIALVPTDATGFWRLKSNTVKWSVKPGGFYGLNFELREAK